MNSLQIIVFLGLVALSCANPVPLLEHGEHLEDDHEESHEPKPYKFEYGVHDSKTGDIKAAKESSDGHTVTGYYELKEADGTMRIVHYSADKHKGFTAHIEKVGTAHHSEVSHHPEVSHIPEVSHTPIHAPIHAPIHVPIHAPVHAPVHVPAPIVENQDHQDSDVVIHYDPEVIHHFTAEVIHHDDDDDDHQYEGSENHEVGVITGSKQTDAEHDFSVVHDKHHSESYQTVKVEKKD